MNKLINRISPETSENRILHAGFSIILMSEEITQTLSGLSSDMIIFILSGSISNHSIFRHDDFIGCFSADKIKKSVRKYFCFNITIYKNMAEELSCRKPFPKEYIQTSASGNPEDLYH